jgi:putative oxidoreductase
MFREGNGRSPGEIRRSWRSRRFAQGVRLTQVASGKLEPALRSLMRIVVGFVFMEHGLQKIFGLLGGLGGHGATAHFISWFWVAGFLEVVGGPLILLGLFTRPVALILSGEMAVAYFWVHAPHGFWPLLNHGELAVLYCFVFLYLAAAGGGPVSADHLVRKK